MWVIEFKTIYFSTVHLQKKNFILSKIKPATYVGAAAVLNRSYIKKGKNG